MPLVLVEDHTIMLVPHDPVIVSMRLNLRGNNSEIATPRQSRFKESLTETRLPADTPEEQDSLLAFSGETELSS